MEHAQVRIFDVKLVNRLAIVTVHSSLCFVILLKNGSSFLFVVLQGARLMKQANVGKEVFVVCSMYLDTKKMFCFQDSKNDFYFALDFKLITLRVVNMYNICCKLYFRSCEYGGYNN